MFEPFTPSIVDIMSFTKNIFKPVLKFRYFSTKRIVKKKKKIDHIWNQHGKWIEMSTNKPIIRSVVLEIACGIFIK